MKYREFLDLTDNEINFILTDIFNPVKIENIQRHPEWNTITVEMTTDGWDIGDSEEIEITDEVTLSMPIAADCGIQIYCALDSNDYLKWKQFCLAKGCNPLLKDNPYLDKKEK